MRHILIIGGTKGIGKAIIDLLIEENKITCMSRNVSDYNHKNYNHIQLDATLDNFPDLEKIDSLVYCPGSINLKPISTLSIEDFRNDFELNVIGAVKSIKKYLPHLKKVKTHQFYYLVLLLLSLVCPTTHLFQLLNQQLMELSKHWVLN